MTCNSKAVRYHTYEVSQNVNFSMQTKYSTKLELTNFVLKKSFSFKSKKSTLTLKLVYFFIFK